jgi:hypothetical protein
MSNTFDKECNFSKHKYKKRRCFCGSPKRYKNCCFGRYNNSLSGYIKELSLINNERGQCHYQNCEITTINSHTISESKHLQPIVDSNDQVYGFKANNFCELDKTNGVFQLQKIYSKRTSSFYGFCGVHDPKLFKLIDSNFDGSIEQIKQAIYRQVLFEKYKNQYILKKYKNLSIFLKNKFLLITTQFENAKLKINDINNDLLNFHSQNLYYQFIEFNFLLPFISSAIYNPVVSKEGTEIVNQGYIDENEKLDKIYFSIIANEGKSVIMLACDETEECSKNFIDDIINMANIIDVVNIAFQLCILTENSFYNIQFMNNNNLKAKAEAYGNKDNIKIALGGYTNVFSDKKMISKEMLDNFNKI